MTFEKRQDKNQEKYCEESKREEKLRRYLKFGNYYIKKKSLNIHMYLQTKKKKILYMFLSCF